MNGPHDLGGRMGFGPVAPEENEPLFHAEWEKRALGIVLCCGALGYWTIDESRHARETIPHTDYLRFSYYRIWLTALIELLQRHGELSAQELASGHAQTAGNRASRRLSVDGVAGVLAKGGPTSRPLENAPLYPVGTRVRVLNLQPTGHIRLPGYLRGHIGVVEAHCGGHVFPDTNAVHQGEQPQHLYTIAFDGADLWGQGERLSVRADLWESYVEPV
ncbi:nitrile hydratase [Monaibacterium marinum]|uniref:Nitrile hydratase subunit beta n=1 Tax=Pontivivens marinum TaxID=1690039 RepID=A0A2C9CTC7_9RHOB|nr:nitrile hydratase subunit beta [Monaibacterium marinum]SOH94415.1 nitrile hydratase [Monaibacterium marinum]